MWIPQNLLDALQRLKAKLPAQETEAIRTGRSSPLLWDRTVGAQLLGDWVDPHNSPLTAYFRRRGIDHPHDISEILRQSYWLYLNHRLTPVDVERMIRARQRYWARILTPEKAAAAQALSSEGVQNPGLLKKTYMHNAVLVADEFDGSNLSARSIALIVQQRSLLDRWVVQRAATRAFLDAEVYRDIVAALDPHLRALTLSLGANTTLLAIDESGIGWALIASRRPGQPLELWRMDMHVRENGPYASQLRCWQSLAGVRPCVALRIGTLPSDTQDRPRFYVDAAYAQPMGATRGRQLSLWRWDGRVAMPLYVISYNIDSDADDQGVSVAGDVIRIASKGSYQTLWACGGCSGRQLVRRIKLTASGQVEQLGSTSMTPELDEIDTLYTRLKNHQPPGDLASTEALTVIERSWNDAERRGIASLFISEPEEVTGRSGGRKLCFLAYYGLRDPMPPILFTFSESAVGLRVVSALESANADARSCAAMKQ